MSKENKIKLSVVSFDCFANVCASISLVLCGHLFRSICFSFFFSATCRWCRFSWRKFHFPCACAHFSSQPFFIHFVVAIPLRSVRVSYVSESRLFYFSPFATNSNSICTEKLFRCAFLFSLYFSSGKFEWDFSVSFFFAVFSSIEIFVNLIQFKFWTMNRRKFRWKFGSPFLDWRNCRENDLRFDRTERRVNVSSRKSSKRFQFLLLVLFRFSLFSQAVIFYSMKTS